MGKEEIVGFDKDVSADLQETETHELNPLRLTNEDYSFLNDIEIENQKESLFSLRFSEGAYKIALFYASDGSELKPSEIKNHSDSHYKGFKHRSNLDSRFTENHNMITYQTIFDLISLDLIVPSSKGYIAKGENSDVELTKSRRIELSDRCDCDLVPFSFAPENVQKHLNNGLYGNTAVDYGQMPSQPVGGDFEQGYCQKEPDKN